MNPSTATQFVNDPTVERCQKRAEMGGYGGVEILNIFAWRSTDPSVLYDLDDPVGPENDEAILSTTLRAGLVICGWGAHGKLHGRGLEVRKMIQNQCVPHVLGLNFDGSPKHRILLNQFLGLNDDSVS